MNGYTPRFTREEFDELRQMIRELGRRRRIFDANDALIAIVAGRFIERGANVFLGHPDDVLALLTAMVHLGELRELDPIGGGPRRWEYTGT